MVFHGFEKSIADLYVNNHEQLHEASVLQLFTGLEKYDPVKDPDPAPEEDVITAEFSYTVDEIVLHW